MSQVQAYVCFRDRVSSVGCTLCAGLCMSQCRPMSVSVQAYVYCLSDRASSVGCTLRAGLCMSQCRPMYVSVTG